jgi:hypothetical protein
MAIVTIREEPCSRLCRDSGIVTVLEEPCSRLCRDNGIVTRRRTNRKEEKMEETKNSFHKIILS